MKIEVTHHVYLHDGGQHQDRVVQLLNRLLQTQENIMASIQEVKDAVAAKALEVKTAISAAIADEKAEVTAAIQALKDQIAAGGSVSVADLDAILGSVGDIGTGVAAEVEDISNEPV